MEIVVGYGIIVSVNRFCDMFPDVIIQPACTCSACRWFGPHTAIDNEIIQNIANDYDIKIYRDGDYIFITSQHVHTKSDGSSINLKYLKSDLTPLQLFVDRYFPRDIIELHIYKL